MAMITLIRPIILLLAMSATCRSLPSFAQAGDPISLIEREPRQVTILELTDLYLAKQLDRTQIDRVLSVEGLATSWREHFTRLLQRT